MRLAYYIDKDEDEWNCSCLYFMHYGCYKHIVRFNKDILKIPVPSKYDIRILTPHKKRGRPKTILGRYISIPTMNISKINTGEISTDEADFSDRDIKLDEFDIKRGDEI